MPHTKSAYGIWLHCMIHITTLTVIGLFFVLKMGLSFFYHNHSNNMLQYWLSCCQMPNAFHTPSRGAYLKPKGQYLSSYSKWITLVLPFLGQDLGNCLDKLVRDHPAFEEQVRVSVKNSMFSWVLVQSLFLYCYSSQVHPHMHSNTPWQVQSSFYEYA